MFVFIIQFRVSDEASDEQGILLDQNASGDF
jgi:hypothetical protein